MTGPIVIPLRSSDEAVTAPLFILSVEIQLERALSTLALLIHFVILSRFRYQFEDSSGDEAAERRGRRTLHKRARGQDE